MGHELTRIKIGLHMKLIRKGKATIVIVILTVVLIAVLGFHERLSSCFFRTKEAFYQPDDYGYIACESDSIFFRTDRRIYDQDDPMIGMLVNLSSHTMEIETWEPLIYELTGLGWMPPMETIHTMQIYPSAYNEDQVQPGAVLPLDLSFLRTKSPPEGPPRWRMLEQPYSYDGNEYVIYSNEIMIGEFSQPARFRAPPDDIVEALSVQVEIVEPYVVALKNDTKLTLWFNPLCSDVKVDVGYTTDYPYYPVLQQQSSEGTWQVLRSDEERCTTVKEPIRIGPGKEVQLFVGDGYPALDELEPGVYRWHLVSFIDPFPDCNCRPDCCFLSGAHLFTQTFEP